MAGPTDLEQLLLEYVNETRVDPLASANRYLTGYAPLRSGDADIQSALTYFGVDGTALRTAFAALSPVQPLAWNDNLASAARTHSQLMIDQQTQAHVLTGEAGLGERITAAGYTGWRTLSENIYAYSEDMLYAHAGFMVDWGNGPNGMQDPAGHRIAIMNGTLNEIGIGVLAETNASTPTGPYVVTQDFGQRTGVGFYLLGVAYSDRDRDGFYSVGEGRSDLIVASGGRSAVSTTSGGYQLSGFSGTGTATLTGGGLAGAVTLTFNAGGENVKADIIDGTTLKLWNAGTATIAGQIGNIMLGGIEGASIMLASDAIDRRLTGYDGNDTLVSGSGHDFVFGGAGADSISGGGGNDHLYGRAASGGADGADVIGGGDGADYIQGNAGDDTLSGGAGSDRIQGGADNDLIHGDDGDDAINGNLGNDEIHGDAGNDQVRGGQGNDTLFGGAGNDAIHGDLGDDRLVGGAGIDMLTGGAGADVFVFSGSDAAFALSGAMAGWTDTIADFADGQDRIDLDFTVAAVLQGQVQADLGAGAAHAQSLMNARAGDSEVAVVSVAGATYIFFSASGGPTIDSAVKLVGVAATAIDTGDFI